MSNLAKTTKLQQLASDPKNSSWVFASAGSGKTKVLTDRVLRLLLDDVHPDKILCLTFTKVAAAEMQQRINTELANWVLLDEESLIRQLEKLSGKQPSKTELRKARLLFANILDAASKIKIQTIHSFCQNLVKIFPFEAGIRPNFEVIESAQEKLLLQKAQKEVLSRATKNPVLKNLVTRINAQLHDETFFELVADLLNKKEQLTILKENYFGIAGVIEQIFKNFSVNKNHSEAEIFLEFVAKINKPQLLKLALALNQSGLISNKKIADPIEYFVKNSELKNFYNYQQAFFTKEKGVRKINGKVLEDPDLASICQSQRDLISDFLDSLNSLKIANSTALLLEFVDQILEIYLQLKRQNSFLDYNDLIVETNRLLNNPNFSDWVKMKMDGLFDHILIDESQDTNHQQWNIIKSLTEDFFSGLSSSNKNRTIFIVGDEKQSIYSFQGAEPDISQEIFSYFAEKLRNHPTQFYKIDLNNSFRSLAAILQIVDQAFSCQKERDAITKISEFQTHQPIRQGVGRFEIWPQIKLKKEQKVAKSLADYEWKLNFEPNENYDEDQFLAEIIALRIKEMVQNNHALEGRDRALNYGDFMILLRNRTNGFDKTLSKVFAKYKIPVASPSKINFADNLIIQDLLAAAKFALTTFDDLNLASLLKSPIFSITEEELLEICLFKNSQETTVYKALGQLEKFSQTTEKLRELIKKSQELNCFEFFNFLLSPQIRQKIIERFGPQSSEIVDKFILKVFDFCQNFSPDLQKFLDFVAKLDLEISLSDVKNNQVFVTTIHSAKGLQAPIVILPDCSFNTNQLLSTKEKISWIQFNQDQLKLPIWCAKKEEENQLLEAARLKKKTQAKEEYLRLLYVAMTRAENQLYMAGTGNSDDEECWHNLVKRSLSGGWSKKFFDESLEKLAAEKFEISGEILGLGAEQEFYKKSDSSAEIQADLNIELFLQKPYTKYSVASKAPKIKILSQIDQAQIKGKLIHKILEVFGKNAAEEKSWLLELAKKLIAREEFLDQKEKNKIFEEVSAFAVSQQFQQLFCGKIQCEVEVAGNSEIRRIDLLCERENDILIVDYKSDEALPKKVPQLYFEQLETYKKLLTNLHPKKKIVTAILWVKFLELTYLDTKAT
jgi:ATP-dependent helicase/nuclease subunit A